MQSIRQFQQGGNGNIFAAYAIDTSPVIFSTAAGTGGPLLWNSPTSGVNAYLLALSFGLTVADTVAGAIGITGNTGQSVVPTSTTAIDSVANLFIGAAAPKCNTYRLGTPAAAGSFFLPVGMVLTGAITTICTDDNWIDLGGAVVVPPGAWASLAAAATLTSAVLQVGLIWAEVPT
ncbi:MAG: hypothetical protein JWO52_7841 [Gammaproteobacteria bacterium]|nr:hypothetical protein [Gammaproteobacteria bacterium]